MHIKSVHKGVKYTCNQCDHQASESRGLKLHKRYVHDGVKVQCKQCDKQFSEASIKTHVKTVHEGVKEYCKHCGQQFTQKNNLKKHVQSKHQHENSQKDDLTE